MRLNPFLSFLRTLAYIFRGRLHFPEGRFGEVVTMEDGQELVIFRQAIVNRSQGQPEKRGATS